MEAAAADRYSNLCRNNQHNFLIMNEKNFIRKKKRSSGIRVVAINYYHRSGPIPLSLSVIRSTITIKTGNKGSNYIRVGYEIVRNYESMIL
jgi:hypothetical protein